jgi:hypothetical protein
VIFAAPNALRTGRPAPRPRNACRPPEPGSRRGPGSRTPERPSGPARPALSRSSRTALTQAANHQHAAPGSLVPRLAACRFCADVRPDQMLRLACLTAAPRTAPARGEEVIVQFLPPVVDAPQAGIRDHIPPAGRPGRCLLPTAMRPMHDGGTLRTAGRNAFRLQRSAAVSAGVCSRLAAAPPPEWQMRLMAARPGSGCRRPAMLITSKSAPCSGGSRPPGTRRSRRRK